MAVGLLKHHVRALTYLSDKVRFWHKTDLRKCPPNVRFRGGGADIPPQSRNFRV